MRRVKPWVRRDSKKITSVADLHPSDPIDIKSWLREKRLVPFLKRAHFVRKELEPIEVLGIYTAHEAPHFRSADEIHEYLMNNPEWTQNVLKELAFQPFFLAEVLSKPFPKETQKRIDRLARTVLAKQKASVLLALAKSKTIFSLAESWRQLSNPRAEMRSAAAHSLAYLSIQPEFQSKRDAISKKLIHCLEREKSAYTRAIIVQSMGHAKNPAFIPALLNSVHIDKSSFVRARSIESIRKIPGFDKNDQVLHSFENRLSDPNKDVRGNALLGLAEINPSKGVSTAEQFMKSQRTVIDRQYGVRALKIIFQKNPSFRPIVKDTALNALHRLGEETASYRRGDRNLIYYFKKELESFINTIQK